MNLKRILALFLAVIALCFVSCVREIDVTSEAYPIYPMIEGKYRAYLVDSTYYTTADTINVRFYKKEQNTGPETDLTNRTIQKLEIHTATFEPQDQPYQDRWEYLQMWSQYADQAWAERIEGNTKYIVLNYPVRIYNKWNGNQFNNIGKQNYQYLNLDTTVVLNGKTYEHCVFILQRENKSRISDVKTYEIYAPNIGKIERYDNVIRKLDDVRLDASNSYFYHETIIDHNF